MTRILAKFDLPFPPSVNHLYPSDSSGRRHISKEYSVWRNAAGWQLKTQRPKCVPGPVEIVITLEERDKRCDCDNRIKPLLDLLVEHGVIDGDHNRTVRSVTARWGDVKGAHVEITAAAQWVQRRDLAGEKA